MSGGRPATTVCIATFDRPHLVGRAVASALDQAEPLAVVVVNTGDPATSERLRADHASDPVEVLDAPAQGLSASRQVGADRVATPWIAFLDDDDVLRPGWSTIMGRHQDPSVGLVSCSAEVQTEDGRVVRTWSATEPVALLDGTRGVHLAGCFAVRTDLYRRVGGYLPGLPCAHQTELWLRLVPAARAAGLRIVSDPEVGTTISGRPVAERALSDPRLLLDGGRWVLARHAEHFRRHPVEAANALGSASVHAARLGEWALSRQLAWGALRAQPRSASRWTHAAAAAVPTVGRRVWPPRHHAGGSTSDRLTVVPALAAATDPPDPALLFLPLGYRTREPSPDGPPPAVASPIHGVDRRPDEGTPLAVGDQLDRVADPYALLTLVRDQLGDGRIAELMHRPRPTAGPGASGPPEDPTRLREWSPDEVTLLVEAAGLRVVPGRRHRARRPGALAAVRVRRADP